MANANYTEEIQAKRASVGQAEKLATLLLGKISEVSGASGDGATDEEFDEMLKHIGLLSE